MLDKTYDSAAVEPKIAAKWDEADAFRAGANAKPGDDIVVAPWWAFPGAVYYGARPNDVSTADSIWVLNWSETGHELPADYRTMTSEPRSGEWLPEHLVAQIANPEEH